MDLLELIRKQIDTLPEGPHSTGLRSVLRHIEAAYRHVTRGQTQQDDSAFTDAIYRTNQAFEGSVKEAYRVLAGKNPETVTPYSIEQYLEQSKAFRNRILTQFTNYRTEWRNPSTHDYNLDFDEDEAFLAIVSVSAFVKLLVDQIAERLSFVAVTENEAHKITFEEGRNVFAPLLDLTVEILKDFVGSYASELSAVPIETESQLMGALSGFLSSVAPQIRYSTGRVFIGPQRHYYVDMIVERGKEQVVIELKRGQHRRLIEDGTRQLEIYTKLANAAGGILFLYAPKAIDYRVDVHTGPGEAARILVLRPNIPE